MRINAGKEMQLVAKLHQLAQNELGDWSDIQGVDHREVRIPHDMIADIHINENCYPQAHSFRIYVGSLSAYCWECHRDRDPDVTYNRSFLPMLVGFFERRQVLERLADV